MTSNYQIFSNPDHSCPHCTVSSVSKKFQHLILSDKCNSIHDLYGYCLNQQSLLVGHACVRPRNLSWGFESVGWGCLPQQGVQEQPSLVETRCQGLKKGGQTNWSCWDLLLLPCHTYQNTGRGRPTFGSATSSQNCGCGTCSVERFHSSAL